MQGQSYDLEKDFSHQLSAGNSSAVAYSLQIKVAATSS
jgi:hypothetical protein